MRTGIIIEVSATDRQQLAAIVADRNAPQKHLWRAHIVLLTADGCGTAEIMRRAGTSKTAVWRWQERFMTEGVEGLLRDKTRPSRIPPLSTAAHCSIRLARPRTGRPPQWPGRAVSVSARFIASGAGMACGRIACVSSSCPTTGSSPASCGTLSDSMSILRPTPSCCRSMRRDPMGTESYQPAQCGVATFSHWRPRMSATSRSPDCWTDRYQNGPGGHFHIDGTEPHKLATHINLAGWWRKNVKACVTQRMWLGCGLDFPSSGTRFGLGWGGPPSRLSLFRRRV